MANLLASRSCWALLMGATLCLVAIISAVGFYGTLAEFDSSNMRQGIAKALFTALMSVTATVLAVQVLLRAIEWLDVSASNPGTLSFLTPVFHRIRFRATEIYSRTNARVRQHAELFLIALLVVGLLFLVIANPWLHELRQSGNQLATFVGRWQQLFVAGGALLIGFVTAVTISVIPANHRSVLWSLVLVAGVFASLGILGVICQAPNQALPGICEPLVDIDIWAPVYLPVASTVLGSLFARLWRPGFPGTESL